MGRTQHTYRMRLQAIRDRLLKSDLLPHNKYDDLWEIAHQLSGPASALPYPDTHAVATFCMILEVIARIEDLKSDLNSS